MPFQLVINFSFAEIMPKFALFHRIGHISFRKVHSERSDVMCIVLQVRIIGMNARCYNIAVLPSQVPRNRMDILYMYNMAYDNKYMGIGSSGSLTCAISGSMYEAIRPD